MKEAYVSFKVAKLLKEKGFDWECRTKYNSNGCIHDNVRMSIGKFMTNLQFFPQEYSAPTQQMAMQWLRTEKMIFISPFPTFKSSPTFKSMLPYSWRVDIKNCFGEDDESCEQCASRETFEECGIRIPAEYFTLDSVETRPEKKCFNGHVTIRYITLLTEKSLVNLNLDANEIGSTGGEVDEVNDRKWIPLKEYRKYDWAFHHGEVIEELIDALGFDC